MSGNVPEQACRILWRERVDGKAVLLRMFGTSAVAVVPDRVADRTVAELAPYCFSPSMHLPEGEIREAMSPADGDERPCCGNGGGGFGLRELCGDYLESVVLPDGIHRIGSFAFYNCKRLKTLEIGPETRDIGSDAFMNAVSLRQISLRCPPSEKSGIRQILGQFSSDMEVVFFRGHKVEARLLYPDYYESYDEIAPAHIFGRSIAGEGFRARQCFKDGVVDFAGYDGIFPQACVEEAECTLSEMALDRLRYPYALGRGSRERYRDYLAGQMRAVSARMVARRDLDALDFLCREGLLRGEELSEAVQRAAEGGWPEGAAFLLSRKSRERAVCGMDRYEFDAF